MPQHANDFPGFQPLPNHNIHAPNEDWDDWEEQAEQEDHWAFPQPVPVLPQQPQVVIPALPEDGAPNSSITTTVSLSDGLLSLTHSASEEVNQGVQVPPIGQGLLNIAMAYNAVGEEDGVQVMQPNADQPQNVIMQHAELTLNVVAEDQQILQPVVVVAQQNLQPVPTSDMPSTVRYIEASDTSMPIVHSDK